MRRASAYGETDAVESGKPAAEGSDTLKGIVFIILAGMFFAWMSVGIRLAGDIPTMEKCVFRNAIALLLSGVALWREGGGPRCRAGNFWPMVGRAVFGSAGLVLNFYANGHINIADANVLNKLSPFVVLICSSVVLKERFRPGHFLIVSGAFLGCLFVVKPSLDLSAMIPSMAGAGGGILAGVALTCVRAMGRRGEREMLVVFYFSAFSTLITLPFLIFNFQPFTVRQFGALMLASVGGCCGQLCVTKAYCYAPAREISVFDYSQILFSALFGWLFLKQYPDIFSWLGYGILLSMGVILFLYNKKLDGSENIQQKV